MLLRPPALIENVLADIEAFYDGHGSGDGVTLPQARRRGYWAAMARRRQAVLPGVPAAGVFSDMSRPGAEALGFLPIVRFTLWRRRRG